MRKIEEVSESEKTKTKKYGSMNGNYENHFYFFSFLTPLQGYVYYHQTKHCFPFVALALLQNLFAREIGHVVLEMIP